MTALIGNCAKGDRLRLPLLLSRQGHRREKLDRVPCSSGCAAIVRELRVFKAAIIMRPEHGSVAPLGR